MFDLKSLDLKSLDLKSLLTEALDIEKARKTTVAVHVLLDGAATPEFQAFVRAGFSSDSSNSVLTIGYYPTHDIAISPDTDLVVMAAGSTPDTGRIASIIRNANIPVLVVAEKGVEILEAADREGYPFPEETVISLGVGQSLDPQSGRALADQVGAWIIKNFHDKRLAFSVAYPIVRRPLAKQAILSTSAQNAGIGVLVFVPGADMPAMTVNQVKMVLQIAAAYGQPLDKDRLIDVLPVLAGAFISRGITRRIVTFVPGIGFIVKGVMGFAATTAMGEAMLTYFENGGNVAGLASVAMQAASTTSKVVSTVRSKPAYQAASDVAKPVVKKAAGTVASKAVAPLAKKAGRAAAGKAVEVAGSVAQSALEGTMDYFKIFTRLRKK